MKAIGKLKGVVVGFGVTKKGFTLEVACTSYDQTGDLTKVWFDHDVKGQFKIDQRVEMDVDLKSDMVFPVKSVVK